MRLLTFLMSFFDLANSAAFPIMGTICSQLRTILNPVWTFAHEAAYGTDSCLLLLISLLLLGCLAITLNYTKQSRFGLQLSPGQQSLCLGWHRFYHLIQIGHWENAFGKSCVYPGREFHYDEARSVGSKISRTVTSNVGWSLKHLISITKEE